MERSPPMRYHTPQMAPLRFTGMYVALIRHLLNHKSMKRHTIDGCLPFQLIILGKENGKGRGRKGKRKIPCHLSSLNYLFEKKDIVGIEQQVI